MGGAGALKGANGEKKRYICNTFNNNNFKKKCFKIFIIMLFGLAGSDLARITLWVDVSGNSEKDGFVRGMTGARGQRGDCCGNPGERSKLQPEQCWSDEL